MLRFVAAALLAVTALAAGVSPAHAGYRIVGGGEVPEGAYPAQAFIDIAGRYCGGTLVARTKVVTAAHCVDVNEETTGDPAVASPSDVWVSLGSNTAGEGTTIPAVAVTIHPSYDRVTSANDVAVITLAAPAEQTPLPLIDPTTDTADFGVGQLATVIGWGRTSWDGPTSSRLRAVDVPIVSDEDCNDDDSYAGGLVTSVMLCAGFPEGGRDSCYGDSGGPLMVRSAGALKLTGIVSFGDYCAEPQLYGVYTEVPASVIRDFITDIAGLPPYASIETVSGASTGTPLTLHAIVYDPTPGGEVTSVTWDLDGDTEFDDASGSDPNWTPSIAGERPIRARVTDKDGMSSVVERTITVAGNGSAGQVNQPPSGPAGAGSSPGVYRRDGASTPIRLTRISAKGVRGVLAVRGVVAADGCSTGAVRVTVYRGGWRLARRFARVSAKCGFATRFSARGRLRIVLAYIAADGTTTRLTARTRRLG